MSSSKPAFSVALWECAAPSSSTRTVPSFPAISSASPVYVTKRLRRLRSKSSTRSYGKQLRTRDASPASKASGGSFPDGAYRPGAFRGKPAEHFAKSRRHAGVDGSFMARGRHPVSEILERSGEGEEGVGGVFYYWKGERPLQPDAPQLDGTAEIRMESAERASGYFTTHSDTDPESEHANGRCLLAR